MPPHRRRFLFVLALLLAALSGACGGDGDGASASQDRSDTSSSVAAKPTGAAGPTVSVKGLTFNPAKLKVKAGETVTWSFDDRAVAHNVVGEGFRSPLKRSGTFSHTFDETGTYPYRCTVHPGMKGSVVVS